MKCTNCNQEIIPNATHICQYEHVDKHQQNNYLNSVIKDKDKQIVELTEKLRIANKALEATCNFEIEAMGACPLDTYGFNNNCAKCNMADTEITLCYVEYYKSKAKEQL
jgi:hypothetical protein